MNNEVYQEIYGHILSDAQRIRKEIMNEWGDILMFGGSMPEDVVGELSTVARITGLSFDSLTAHGVDFAQVNGKPGLYTLTVREERFVCHQSAIPSLSGFLDVVNIPGVPMQQSAPAPAPTRAPSPRGVAGDSPSRGGAGAPAPSPAPSVQSSFPMQEQHPEAVQELHRPEAAQRAEPAYQQDRERPNAETAPPAPQRESLPSAYEKEPQHQEAVASRRNSRRVSASDFIQAQPRSFGTKTSQAPVDNFPPAEEGLQEEPLAVEDVSDEDAPMPVPMKKEKAPELPEAVHEMHRQEDDGPGLFERRDQPNIGSFLKSDIFLEEREKAEHEIVYEMFDVTLTHSGFSGGGRPMDAKIMIAPLKIQRFTCPSVPIIVSVYHKGKITTSSSYDQAEDGRNLVMLNVDEFYLLFRGSFDGDCKFKAFVTTTGISASQGDILNITSESRHGDNAGRNVNNGHVKFRATVYDEPGTIEAFPFGEREDNEFVVMTKTDEFVDYMYISGDSGGLKKAIIFQNSKKVAIECAWVDDKLVTELKEV